MARRLARWLMNAAPTVTSLPGAVAWQADQGAFVDRGIPFLYLGVADHEKIRPGQFEALCNPVSQAEMLNAHGCQFNVVMGLCIGHDSLFFRYAKGLTTVLVAKDRVLGHNPVAALYTSHSYYRRLTGC